MCSCSAALASFLVVLAGSASECWPSSRPALQVKHSLVFENKNALSAADTPWTDGRDTWWHDNVPQQASEAEVEWVGAEDPLFLLYTSGSTGKPKGVLHTTGVRGHSSSPAARVTLCSACTLGSTLDQDFGPVTQPLCVLWQAVTCCTPQRPQSTCSISSLATSTGRRHHAVSSLSLGSAACSGTKRMRAASPYGVFVKYSAYCRP